MYSDNLDSAAREKGEERYLRERAGREMGTQRDAAAADTWGEFLKKGRKTNDEGSANLTLALGLSWVYLSSGVKFSRNKYRDIFKKKGTEPLVQLLVFRRKSCRVIILISPQNEMKFYIIIICVPPNNKRGKMAKQVIFFFIYPPLINFCIPADRNISLCSHSCRRTH